MTSANAGSHCQRSGRPSGMTAGRRRIRRSSRGRARRSKRGGQSHQGVSHRGDCRNREMSVATHAGSSRWDSGRTSHRKCRKGDGTDKCWGRSRRHWKGQRPRQAWPSIESGSVKENDWRRDVLSPVVPCAHRAQPSTPLTPASRSQHAMWSSPRSRARFNRACVRRALASLSTTAVMFFQRGGANPAGRPLSLAWSRALRAADSASRISPLSFDGDKRSRMRQFFESVAF